MKWCTLLGILIWIYQRSAGMSHLGFILIQMYFVFGTLRTTVSQSKKEEFLKIMWCANNNPGEEGNEKYSYYERYFNLSVAAFLCCILASYLIFGWLPIFTSTIWIYRHFYYILSINCSACFSHAVVASGYWLITSNYDWW